MKCNIGRKDNKPKYEKNADPRLKGIVEHIDEMTIGLDDTFKFGCKMCGKCCTYREDIILSSKDVFNLATALQIKPEEVVVRYCDTYLGPTSRFPIVKLKSVGADNRCPFLQDKKCSVHKLKPTVCAMFPLGRYIKAEDTEIDPTALTTASIRYLVQPTACGDGTETHTVREWLETFGIDLEDKFFIEWQKVLASVGPVIRRLIEAKTDTALIDRLCSWEYILLYLQYDMDQDFLTQFMDNAERAISFAKAVESEVLGDE